MCSARGALWSALVAVVVARDVIIGVVDSSPELTLELKAAVMAAGAGVAQGAAASDPREALPLPRLLCDLGAEETRPDAVIVGRAGAEAGAGAGARAGVPLLLVEAAPELPASAALHLVPHHDLIAQVVRELCLAKGWRAAVLLHEASSAAAGTLAALAPDPDELALLPRRLPTADDEDNSRLRNLLLVLKKSGWRQFIVWCEAECGARVLRVAQVVGLLAERHAYIVPALDLHVRPLANYTHGGANITALQLFDPDAPHLQRLMDRWEDAYRTLIGNAVEETTEEYIAATKRAPRTALVLAHDAAAMVMRAAQWLGGAAPPDAVPGRDACVTGRAALNADTLLNYITSEEWHDTAVCAGGWTRWEGDGWRRAAGLHVWEAVRGGGRQGAARAAPPAPLVFTRPPQPEPPRPLGQMTNRTFVFLIALNKPYIMKQESTARLTGNNRYEGFCIELIQKLSELLEFNYTLQLQPDNKYGEFDNDTQQWNGMLYTLRTDDSVHFGITDLTITAQRESAVDFTTPFMNLGIAILFRKPQPPEPKTFAFLLPFSTGVWICLGVAYVGTSLVLYCVGRVCPAEWQNPHPCIEEPAELHNQFTLANALWFNLGAILQQGSEIAPVAYGTRAVASVWWIFALVVTSSYTANLASLLALVSEEKLIENVDDLANNTLGISYGAKTGGSTLSFFEHSQNQQFQYMYRHMKNTDSNDAGISKVMKENYAFLMESTTIEYVTERNCEVKMIGDLLDSKGYGIAMRKESPYRQALNLALLNLQESGVLREMKHRWWREKHGGGACHDSGEKENEKLQMKNFLGLWYVLGVGCVLGVVLSVVDLARAAAQRPDAEKPFSHRFLTELKFVFRFEQSEKPVGGAPSDESSPSASPPPSPLASVPASPVTSVPSSRRASRRRRSSMSAASARLARHTRASRSRTRHRRDSSS